jgi:hypothetical protein
MMIAIYIAAPLVTNMTIGYKEFFSERTISHQQTMILTSLSAQLLFLIFSISHVRFDLYNMMIAIYIAAPLVTNMTIGYMESSNRNSSMGN